MILFFAISAPTIACAWDQTDCEALYNRIKNANGTITLQDMQQQIVLLRLGIQRAQLLNKINAKISLARLAQLRLQQAGLWHCATWRTLPIA